MILQRIASAIRRQDGFQIIIEIFIVVVGIFLGLQVTEWADEREDRNMERAYLNRLHDEVVQGLNFTGTNFDALLLFDDFTQNYNLIAEILSVFEGGDIKTELGPRHCLAIMTSAIYNDQSTFPPTITELTSSGQLPLIQSEVIKIALSNFIMSFDALNGQVEGIQSSPLVLARKYPDLIQLDRKMENLRKPEEFEHICQFEEMKNSIPFNNDLIDNRARLYAFVLTLSNHSQRLINLHDELDGELGITHVDGS